MVADDEVSFTDLVPGLGALIAPLFFTPQELDQAAPLHEITREPILHNLQNSEKYKISQHHIGDNINSFNNTNNVWNS